MFQKGVIAILFVFTQLVSQGQAFTEVKDVSVLQSKINEASRKVNTIQCDFTQEKTMKMLADKVVSSGKFYFKKDNQVRLEYLKPNKNLIVMNSGKMLVKDEKKTAQTDMHKSKLFKQLNTIIVGSINGSLFVNRDYSVRYYESGNQIKVEMITLSKTLKNFLSSVVLFLEKKDFTATRIEMHEPSSDNTILTFSSKQINTTLPDSLFAVK